MQASEAEWHEPYFVFKLTQANVCVKQTDAPHCAETLTGWLRKSLGEEPVVQVSDNGALDRRGGSEGGVEGADLEICRW